ncbi:unnamed protein product, partial [Amoebophrya sp. A25]
GNDFCDLTFSFDSSALSSFLGATGGGGGGSSSSSSYLNITNGSCTTTFIPAPGYNKSNTLGTSTGGTTTSGTTNSNFSNATGKRNRRNPNPQKKKPL